MMMLTYVGSRGCWETYMVKYTLYNLPKDLVDWKVWVFGVTTTDEIIMATTCDGWSTFYKGIKQWIKKKNQPKDACGGWSTFYKGIKQWIKKKNQSKDACECIKT
ncbi:hypothetical protein YC2023_043227 [Brassica napus]